MLAVAGASAASADFLGYPTITEAQAEGDAHQFMHRSYPGRRHKRVGYIDCAHGRVDRFTWSCAVGRVSGHLDRRQGRLRVINEEVENGVYHYEVKAHTVRRC